MPEFPADLAHYMEWELSPPRPWEWWQIEACDWRAAQAVQAAYRDGQADARAEQQAKGGTP